MLTSNIATITSALLAASAGIYATLSARKRNNAEGESISVRTMQVVIETLKQEVERLREQVFLQGEHIARLEAIIKLRGIDDA